jgi:hypothetical protein
MARNGLLLSAAAFSMSLVAALTPFSPAYGEAQRRKIETKKDFDMADNNFAGLWVTGDGHIRHELLANGRYVEARGDREKAYEGAYWVSGDHIEYKDDTGFTADGDFKDGILYHADMVLYRRDN